MSLLTAPFRLPLLPVLGVVRLAELITEQAERELADPAALRRELEEAERARDARLLSEEEFAGLEEALVRRFMAARDRGGGLPGEG